MINNFIPTLKYGVEDQIAPIAPAEKGVQTIYAEPWLKVEQTCFSDLEGTNFDREGNLWFVEAGGPASKLHKVNCDTKDDVVVYEDPEKRAMSAVKPHKNGRIWIPSVGPTFKEGYIFSCNPDGTDYRIELQGPVVDDMCFDSKGGYYYNDFTGNVSEPNGAVYYVAPDGTQTTLLDGLCGPNGLALSKDEKTVWITESNAMRLTRVSLDPEGGPTDIAPLIAPFGVHVCYYFSGGGVCDSCEIDDDDNLYVSMYEQGRVMVFNKAGWLIGQILMPGRENGDHLGTTHTAIRPGTNELYICTNDSRNGAWIFKCGAFAKASLASYQYL